VARDPFRLLVERRLDRAEQLAADARRAFDEDRLVDAGILRGRAIATRDFAAELEHLLDGIASGYSL
jgi:hypothetical protein